MKKLEEIKTIVYYGVGGHVESIQPYEECHIETEYGCFTPIYCVEEQGRKKLSPVKFHKNGTIKSIALQRPQTVKTSIGEFEAELVTFHPDGSLNRIFPLNGKLSGYWSELNEYNLAETLTIPTYWGVIAAKPINIQFYKTGLLKSITLWPGERVTIETPEGEMLVRKGISFYKDGSLQSCEPAEPVTIRTVIGELTAFDPESNGLDGSRNSLTFSEAGDVTSIATCSDTVQVIDDWGFRFSFSPRKKYGLCDEKEKERTEPLKILFDQEMTVFRSGLKTVGKVHLNSRFFIKDYTKVGTYNNEKFSEAG